MNFKRQYGQSGFTLVELLIATTVFSVILLIAAAGLIQVGRLYYKGIITAKTQNVARQTMDDVTRSLQFSQGRVLPQTAPNSGNPSIQVYCFGETRYSYLLKSEVKSNPNPSNPREVRHALWRDKIGSDPCLSDVPDLRSADPDGPGSSRGGKELLEENMRLQQFDISPLVANEDDAYSVHIEVVYGDDDMLDDGENPTACKGALTGSQWCAISDLSSVVYSRVK